MNSGIYQIYNIIDGKRYIGSSKDVIKRSNDHFGSLKNNKHHSRKLQNAFNKYGEQCFKFKILANNIPLNHLIELEQLCLDTATPQYNINLNATSSLGVKRTLEFRETKRQQGLGRRASKETRLKMSLKRRKEKHPLWGTHHSKETIEKIKITRNRKEVFQYDSNNNFIARYDSVKHASDISGFDLYSIRNSCNGLYPYDTYKGFRWSYKKY